jgi:transposase InsO family protein
MSGAISGVCLCNYNPACRYAHAGYLLRAYDSVSDARASLGRYLDFYNSRRPHSSLDGMTPDQAYFPPLPLRLAA